MPTSFVPLYSPSPQNCLWHPSIRSPKPRFHHINDSFIKSFIFLGLSSFYVCSSLEQINLYSPAICFLHSWYWLPSGCTTRNEWFPASGWPQWYPFFPLIFSQSSPLPFAFSGILNLHQYLQALSLTLSLLADFLEKTESLKYKLFQLLLFSRLTYNLLIHFYPFSPSGREQRTLLSEISSFFWILNYIVATFLFWGLFFLKVLLALFPLPHNKKLTFYMAFPLSLPLTITSQ